MRDVLVRAVFISCSRSDSGFLVTDDVEGSSSLELSLASSASSTSSACLLVNAIGFSSLGHSCSFPPPSAPLSGIP